MSKPVVEVQVRGMAATGGGRAVFLGNEEKLFVIFVDQSVGAAIAMFKQGTQKERPLTHDLCCVGLPLVSHEVINSSKVQALFSRYSTPAEHLNITPVFRFYPAMTKPIGVQAPLSQKLLDVAVRK